MAQRYFWLKCGHKARTTAQTICNVTSHVPGALYMTEGKYDQKKLHAILDKTVVLKVNGVEQFGAQLLMIPAYGGVVGAAAPRFLRKPIKFNDGDVIELIGPNDITLMFWFEVADAPAN